MLAQTFAPSVPEEEAGVSMSLGLTWSIYWVLGQTELHSETLYLETPLLQMKPTNQPTHELSEYRASLS